MSRLIFLDNDRDNRRSYFKIGTIDGFTNKKNTDLL